MFSFKLFLIIMTLTFNSFVIAKEKNKDVEMSKQCLSFIDTKKYYEALDVCKKMAKKGNPSSQFNLGILYYQGLGVMSDKRIAIKWIKKAAKNNHATAQYNLGIMTANGIGTDTDLVKAYAWLKTSEKNGYKEATSAVNKMAEELSEKEKKEAEKIQKDLVK